MSGSRNASICGNISTSATSTFLLPQVLRHFDADEAASDDDSLLRAGMNCLDDAVHVRDRPQRIDPVTLDAGDRWTQWRAAGTQDQLVVVVDRDRSGGEISGQRPCVPADRCWSPHAMSGTRR